MFDSFKDYDSCGYLRNTAGEKDREIVKRLEHSVFMANLPDGMTEMVSCKTLGYADFLSIHELFFKDIYPRARQDRRQTAPGTAISKAGTLYPHLGGLRLSRQPWLAACPRQRKAAQKSWLQQLGCWPKPIHFSIAMDEPYCWCAPTFAAGPGFRLIGCKTNKTDYLRAFSFEIEQPGKGILNTFLRPFIGTALDTPGMQKDRAENFRLERHYLRPIRLMAVLQILPSPGGIRNSSRAAVTRFDSKS